MKFVLSTFLFAVTLFLPSIICTRSLIHYSDYVDDLAESDELINDIFKPMADGHLGMGSFAFAHQGVLLPIMKEVAMKFTTYEKRYLADEEYEMYTYLGAINDTNVERFGIPVVYYYGKCNKTGLILMAVSLLERDIQDFVFTKKLFESDVNILILLRDFILSSKYIHSKGIRHDDIKLENLMAKRDRTFLIDFNISNKMNERSKSGTLHFLSRGGLSNGVRYPKDDWESFLYSVCTTLGVKFPWSGRRSLFEVFMMKANTTNTLALIKTIKSELLRDVLYELAQHIFDDGTQDSDSETSDNAIDEFESDSGSEDSQTELTFKLSDKKRFPDYNRWYKLVDDKIKESNLPKPAMFSWLTPKEKEEAVADLKTHPVPDITKINEPIECDYSAFKYPDVEKFKFVQAYKDWKPSPELLKSLEAAKSSRYSDYDSDDSESKSFESAKTWHCSKKNLAKSGSKSTSFASATQTMPHTAELKKNKNKQKSRSH